jgi:hypothetical protein
MPKTRADKTSYTPAVAKKYNIDKAKLTKVSTFSATLFCTEYTFSPVKGSTLVNMYSEPVETVIFSSSPAKSLPEINESGSSENKMDLAYILKP